jgi:hypothetical protein
VNYGLLGWPGQGRPFVLDLVPVPLQVPGLVLWLKADAIAGLTSGANIVSWVDSSGKGNTATGGTSGSTTPGPTWIPGSMNGLPVARFNGTSNVLALPGSFSAGSNSTLFFVAKPTATTPGGLFDSAPGQQNTYRNNPAGSWEWWNASPSFALSLADTNPVVLAFASSLAPSRSVTYERNNSAVGTYTNASTSSLAWLNPVVGNINGTSPWYAGDLAELLIYNATLSQGQRQLIARYLGSKYNITVA